MSHLPIHFNFTFEDGLLVHIGWCSGNNGLCLYKERSVISYPLSLKEGSPNDSYFSMAGAGLAQWWERSPSTNVPRVRFDLIWFVWFIHLNWFIWFTVSPISTRVLQRLVILIHVYYYVIQYDVSSSLAVSYPNHSLSVWCTSLEACRFVFGSWRVCVMMPTSTNTQFTGVTLLTIQWSNITTDDVLLLKSSFTLHDNLSN